MTPEQVERQAKAGELLPVYLVAGEEQLLRDRVVSELQKAALDGGLPDFNEDKFTAGEAPIDRVLTAARTLPMMARRRFVLVRSLERWDARQGDGDSERDDGEPTAPLDRLAEYAQDPSPSTCVVLVANKLDGRRKLALLAKKSGFLVSCEPLGPRELVAWVAGEFAARGHAVDEDVPALLPEIAGSDMAMLRDAIERLCLYVGAGERVTERAVQTCVARVRTADTWALVVAVGARDLGAALRLLNEVYDPRDRGLPLLGALAWSVRQLARMQAALSSGASPEEAGRRAGVFQPHRARELGSRARAFRPRELERWLLVLSEADLALKGSRRAPQAILEDMLTRLGVGRPHGPPGRAAS
jgi:DNA polymerase-3 subunit delta